MEPLYEEQVPVEKSTFNIFYPITFVSEFLSSYGWYVLGGAIAAAYIVNKLSPSWRKWQQAREDAEYHKDPDKALARMEAIQRARERQQQLLLEASERALEQQREREERKRQETVERLKKYGAAVGTSAGNRLGTEQEYLPLSGGASSSSYRPPKKSKCGGGGCGR